MRELRKGQRFAPDGLRQAHFGKRFPDRVFRAVQSFKIGDPVHKRLSALVKGGTDQREKKVFIIRLDRLLLPRRQ